MEVRNAKERLEEGKFDQNTLCARILNLKKRKRKIKIKLLVLNFGCLLKFDFLQIKITMLVQVCSK